MSSAIAGAATALGTAANSIGWFVPMLVAAIAYFQYEEYTDPEQRPIDVVTEDLLKEYDFIIIGSGSAGNRELIQNFNAEIIRIFLILQELWWQIVCRKLKIGMFFYWKLEAMKQKFQMFP